MAHNSLIPGTPVKKYLVAVPEELAILVETIAEFLYVNPEAWIVEVLGKEVTHYDTGKMDFSNQTRKRFDQKWNEEH